MPYLTFVLMALLAVVVLMVAIPVLIALGGALVGMVLAVRNLLTVLTDVRAQEK